MHLQRGAIDEIQSGIFVCPLRCHVFSQLTVQSVFSSKVGRYACGCENADNVLQNLCSLLSNAVDLLWVPGYRSSIFFFLFFFFPQSIHRNHASFLGRTTREKKMHKHMYIPPRNLSYQENIQNIDRT